jgi:pyruvate kinase
MRHTKIIATIGPASDSEHMLDALIAAGVDIVRLNFSHGTHESHGLTFERVRRAARHARREVAIMQDLSGPKIRIGRLSDPLKLHAGDILRIVTGDFVGGPGRVSTTFEELARGVKSGDRLLVADGLIELRVERSDGTEIETTVVEGGTLGQHKGISAPGVKLSASAITPKDVDDLKFGLSLGVDMVAVSFVQSAHDLRRTRHLISDMNGGDVSIVAKLERPGALDDIDQILRSCEAVMVARGDLGLEMPFEQVPRVQKDITIRARQQKVPVIVATQVLQSMTVEPRPTRAEVSDAANAVADGVDAIMLSGETAIGAFPARAVQTLDAIIRDAESGPWHEGPARYSTPDDHYHVQAICEAAVTLAERGSAAVIVAVTQGGGTARRLSALRPHAPILATIGSDKIARRLILHWGVSPVCFDIGDNLDAAGPRIGQELIDRGFLTSGATVVLVRVNTDLSRTDANYLKIQRL